MPFKKDVQTFRFKAVNSGISAHTAGNQWFSHWERSIFDPHRIDVP